MPDPYQVNVLDPMFYSQRYAVRRQKATPQVGVANDTLVLVDFTGAAVGSFDRGSFFTAPSTFTIPSTGVYAFGSTVSFADNATGTRYLEIIKNDTNVLIASEANSNSGTVHFVTITSSSIFNASDTLKVRVRQTSGAPLDLTVSSEQSPVFWAIYIGRFVN